MDNTLLLDVKYKFKGDKKSITVSVTEKQYVNLLELPIIDSCEIIGKAEQKIPLEIKQKFNERIKIACEQNEVSHTKYLIQ